MRGPGPVARLVGGVDKVGLGTVLLAEDADAYEVEILGPGVNA